jgi:spore coat protein CotF
MKNDYLDVANAVGMPEVADSTIAMSFLIDAKNAIKNYALALAEAQNPQVRMSLTVQLQDAIALYSETVDLLMDKGWLHPQDLSHQSHVDIKSAEAAMMIAGLDLFPGDTNRLGMFPTDLKSSRRELS